MRCLWLKNCGLMQTRPICLVCRPICLVCSCTYLVQSDLWIWCKSKASSWSETAATNQVDCAEFYLILCFSSSLQMSTAEYLMVISKFNMKVNTAMLHKAHLKVALDHLREKRLLWFSIFNLFNKDVASKDPFSCIPWLKSLMHSG